MKQAAKEPIEATARALLAKHGCPTPFHEVRTRFLGRIAAPGLSISPLQAVKELWGGELPEFGDIDELNELLGALLQGLWNDLTRHQRRSQPFRLSRTPMEPTSSNIGEYGLVRLQELDGFVEGLFNGAEVVDLPERAHQAVGHLSELRAIMADICELSPHAPDANDRSLINATFKHLRDVTQIMEAEIHAVVLSCAQARRQVPEGISTANPTIH